ncbi:hypothetical protein KAU39_08785, partial [bacterium]|nr:hypothetical protein [bacterium]
MKIEIKQVIFGSVSLVIMAFCFYSSAFGMGSKRILPKPSSIKILMRTGSIIVTRPDNKIFNVDLEDEIPWIPSGSMIEVVWGRAKVSIGVGEIIIKKGGRIKLWENKKTGTVSVVVPKRSKTNIKVSVGETFVIVNKGDKIKITIDEIAKIAKIMVIKGKIDVIRGQERFTANQGSVIETFFNITGRLSNLPQPEPEVIEDLEASP